MTPPKEQNDTPGTSSKEVQLHELPDEEFITIVAKKFSELKENTGIQLSGTKKATHEQNQAPIHNEEPGRF